jgi:hypothetical protein
LPHDYAALPRQQQQQQQGIVVRFETTIVVTFCILHARKTESPIKYATSNQRNTN